MNTFWPPSDATSILKNLKIDAGSEPEILIKSIQNYSFIISIYLMLILSCDALSILENLRIYACMSHFKKVVQMHWSYNLVPIY